MANTTWRATKARCPFYCGSTNRCITCADEGGDKIRRRFRTDRACADWFRRFCAQKFKSCSVYEMIRKEIEAKGKKHD